MVAGSFSLREYGIFLLRSDLLNPIGLQKLSKDQWMSASGKGNKCNSINTQVCLGSLEAVVRKWS